MFEEQIEKSANAIINADFIIIGAGAGMGVDSGLPDFRGTDGFWESYPQAKKLNLDFKAMANPANFGNNTALAWGFYGHRYNLYKNTEPHQGYKIILDWINYFRKDYIVFTSNVDGHFLKAGFSENKILECHGNINYWQCCGFCDLQLIWKAKPKYVYIDESTFQAIKPFPRCSTCGGIARPNILMFNDYFWLSDRTDKQRQQITNRLKTLNSKDVAIIEIGAGKAIPSVRMFCESINGTLIRINPENENNSQGFIHIPQTALKTIMQIDNYIAGRE